MNDDDLKLAKNVICQFTLAELVRLRSVRKRIEAAPIEEQREFWRDITRIGLARRRKRQEAARV